MLGFCQYLQALINGRAISGGDITFSSAQADAHNTTGTGITRVIVDDLLEFIDPLLDGSLFLQFQNLLQR